ncbi:TIR domain-containing protein [Halorarum salinum]|uniref:Nucleoside 2-deoxyribosyltransferase n=1 Tax=Halorarum salinum TaxID=2743089 RepID=A0A7D5QGF2_9EURY|nr:hypothetical protein [Halobaculum salinum]QLG62002.1 hypothetical protein HUG12_09815 [Halobaculum salinum]
MAGNTPENHPVAQNEEKHTVYLAGPISDGPNPFEWHEKIQSTWPEISWINPFEQHGHSQVKAREHVEEIIARDLEMVKASDAVLLRRIGHRNLAGASIEAYVATEHDIPVIIWNDTEESVPLFLEGHSRAVYESLEEAVNNIFNLLSVRRI